MKFNVANLNSFKDTCHEIDARKLFSSVANFQMNEFIYENVRQLGQKGLEAKNIIKRRAEGAWHQQKKQ